MTVASFRVCLRNPKNDNLFPHWPTVEHNAELIYLVRLELPSLLENQHQAGEPADSESGGLHHFSLRHRRTHSHFHCSLLDNTRTPVHCLTYTQ